MRRQVCIIVLTMLVLVAVAGERRETLSMPGLPTDTTPAPTSEAVMPQKRDIFHKVGNFFTRYFRDFNATDTSYIEPQHFNYAFMLQNTNTYEVYRVSSKSGQSVTFSPDLTYRIGPYFGWRWVFLGYTFDVSHISNSHNKKELDVSLYSNLVSVDFYYRKTGTDYHIRRVVPDGGRSAIRNLDIPFSGLNVGITGLNLTYIFNHKRFSYPAAFSQSTVQRRSCGSALAGFGYTRHSIDLDSDQLQEAFGQLPGRYGTVSVDSGMYFDRVKYTNLALSGGYAYNLVFARNWLAAASLALSMGYKSSAGELLADEHIERDFSFSNLTFDATGRFGVVWNNTRWFAGMSAIMHSYNYRKRQFSTNNTFGSINFYLGFNFARKRGH